MLVVTLLPGLLSVGLRNVVFPWLLQPFPQPAVCTECPLSRKQSTIEPDVIHCAVMHSESSAKLISHKFEMSDSKTQNRCVQ